MSSSTTVNINSNRLNSGTCEKQHFHAEQAEKDRLSGASGSRDTTHNPPASRLAGKRPVAMETLTPCQVWWLKPGTQTCRDESVDARRQTKRNTFQLQNRTIMGCAASQLFPSTQQLHRHVLEGDLDRSTCLPLPHLKHAQISGGVRLL